MRPLRVRCNEDVGHLTVSLATPNVFVQDVPEDRLAVPGMKDVYLISFASSSMCY